MTKSLQAPDIGTDGGYDVFGPLGDIGYEKSDSWIDVRFLQGIKHKWALWQGYYTGLRACPMWIDQRLSLSEECSSSSSNSNGKLGESLPIPRTVFITLLNKSGTSELITKNLLVLRIFRNQHKAKKESARASLLVKVKRDLLSHT